MINQAREQGSRWVRSTLESLDRWNNADQEDFRYFFKDSSEETRMYVRNVFAKMDSLLDSYTSRNFMVYEGDDALAFVDPGNKGSVFVEPRFFEGTENSQARVLIHEVSHFWDVGSTDDLAAGLHQILTADTGTALSNANTYAVYASFSSGHGFCQ